MLTAQQRELVKSTVPVLKESGPALTAYFYNRMLTNHPELKSIFNMGHQRSGAQANALAGAVLAYASHIDNPAVLATAIEHIAHKHVSLNILPEHYPIVGENLLMSICEVLGVEFESDLVQAWGAAYQQLADILIAAEKGMYQENLTKAHGWNGWREFKVADKVVESDEITSFYLTPIDGGKVPEYVAGQYTSLRVFVPQLQLIQPRQYTLSDAYQPNMLRISVKKELPQGELAEGYVSNTLHRDINVGDTLELSAPQGNFMLHAEQTPVVLISAGVGITPMIAMLNQLMAQGTKQPVHFVHACRNGAVHAMKSHVNTLVENNENLTSTIYYEVPETTQVEGVDYDYAGRLILADVADKLIVDNAHYYLCGPTGFMQAQYNALLALGVNAQQIHLEAFGTGGISL